MVQAHGDRLSHQDAAFLHIESATTPMHVGGLFAFDASGPTFDFERFVWTIHARLHLVPRYRQRLAFAPLNLAPPMWVDDTAFDIAYHVRHAALPAPGTDEQLREYAARVLSRPLDLDKPLWEITVVEGRDDGGFAIIGKSHHALVDGIAGLDIATVLFDLTGEAAEDLDPEPWQPQPTPSGQSLLASAAQGYLQTPTSLLVGARTALAGPERAVRQLLGIGMAVTRFARDNVRLPTPRSVLNRQPSRGRRFVTSRIALDDLRAIKNTFSTTVNDVVLALVSDALGRYLRLVGERTDGRTVRTMVPVSTRREDQEGGNQVVSVFVDLPVDEMDPVQRLESCHAIMQEVKATHQATGAQFFLDMTQFAPPTIHAVASRMVAGSRLFDFLVTNVPGPAIPIYCLGSRLVGAYPYLNLTPNHTLFVGVTSLSGWMSFGVTADYDAHPLAKEFDGFLMTSLGELQACAGAVGARHEAAERAKHVEPPARPATGT